VRDRGVAELAPLIGTAAACTAAGRSRAIHYRRHRISAAPARRRAILHVDRVQPAALSAAEREQVLEILHSDRFADAARLRPEVQGAATSVGVIGHR
jgi:putative transposase